MRTRSVLALAVPFLLLSACAPAAPADSPEPSDPAPTETEFPGGVAIGLPEDGLLGMHATLTALNGAVLDLTMIVHRSVAATDDAVSADAAAMESWCSGEIDAQILADQGYTLTVVDVDATLTSGEWPAATPVLLYPIPWERAVLTASGDLKQVSTGSEGDSTPHCITPVTLDGPGSGTIIVGIAGDADGDGDGTPPLGGWAHNLFGADATLPGGTLSDVMFTNCYTEVSELGASLGAGTVPGWNTWFDDPTFCYVGSFGQG